MKTHYSIAELHELELDGLPTSRRGLEKYVLAHELKYKEVPSRGKGGIRKEYELNNELLRLYEIKNLKQEVVAEFTETKVSIQNPPIQIAIELANWQREIGENRLFVVRYIQQQIKKGIKKTPAIEQFITDAEAFVLPKEIQTAVQKANAKAGEGRTVSRRSVFDWVKAVDDAEKHKINVMSVLAPKARQSEIPAWAVELLKLWAQPQKPTIPAVLELLPNYLKANVPCPTYNQAYRFIKEKMGNVEAQRGRMGIAAVQSLANSNQNRITLLEQEVGNLRAMFNNQPSAQDILNLMYPVGSISLAAPLNGTGGVVWGGLGNTYDVNPYTYRRIS